MGKGEREPPQDAAAAAAAAGSQELLGSGGGGRGGGCRRFLRLRCVAALVLGVVVLLSALFWLPPFACRRGASEADRWLGAEVVASFRLQRTVSELNENISKLEYDIFEEIGTRNSTVAVTSLEPITGSNWTNVVFGVWPYPRNSTISPTELSILRSSLVSLVIQQSTLHLTSSLFGNSSFFEVLKFPGRITIIPPQNAFPQKPDALFNFSLNFSIDVVQDKVSELKAQMKSGLFLNSYENLYVTLTNLEGSTITPPTVVETSIILAIGRGNRPPSLPRLKQLAQTLRNSSSGNLGLNHTVFGRVKQISLSSYLQHSLNNGGSGGSASSPSPAPQPSNDHHPPHHNHDHHHHHHHHSHHHHHHHLSRQVAQHLTPAHAPAPAPQDNRHTPTFVICGSRCVSKKVPGNAKHHSAPHVDPPLHPIVPVASPKSSYASGPDVDPPASVYPRISASPLSAVVLGALPPSKSVGTSKHPNRMSSITPAPSTSSASGLSTPWWVVTPLLYLSVRLL